ncbi:MAG: pyroglutamyl-peptidase I [Firmicutes bacterium]|nr:pyroglutamyl-peptidase I [Bacillota bacterium]
MKTIVFTGFEPFGGEATNPSWRAVEELMRRPGPVRLIARQIPTVFGQAARAVEEVLGDIQPDGLVCVGQAGGSTGLRVERVGVNLNDARIPDNAGQQPVDQPIVAGGPAAYWSTLPTRRLVEALGRAGIPAELSYSAGTFVCNHVLYSALHYAAAHGLKTRVGFIHVPYLPEQAVGKANTPCMSLETMVRGLEIVAQELADWLEACDLAHPSRE